MKGEPLSNIDTAWLRLESPLQPMMITVVMILGPPLDLPRLQAVFRHRLLRFRRFRQRVVRPALGPAYWADDPAGWSAYIDYDGIAIGSNDGGNRQMFLFTDGANQVLIRLTSPSVSEQKVRGKSAQKAKKALQLLICHWKQTLTRDLPI